MCFECSNQTSCFCLAFTVSNHAPATSKFTFRFVAALQEDERNGELVDRGEVERNRLGEQIGCGELIAFPNAANFLIAVIWRELGERAIGRVVAPLSHHAAIITDHLRSTYMSLIVDDSAGGG